MALDQVTKFLAVAHLTTHFDDARATTLAQRLVAFVRGKELLFQARGAVTLFESWWSFRYAENHGAAWSLLAEWPASIRLPFFAAVGLSAVVLVAAFFRRTTDDHRVLRLALACLLGGALGNSLDRLLHGYVIDFIDWHWRDPLWLHPTRHWPTFNLADVALFAAVSLVAWDGLRSLVAREAPSRPPGGPLAPGPAHGAPGPSGPPQAAPAAHENDPGTPDAE